MLGAIIGDIVGSCYEFNNIKTTDFPLISQTSARSSTPTDDTVCTISVAEALLKISDDDSSEPDFVTPMRLWCTGYPNAGYGTLFWDWLQGQSSFAPYHSWGNGAAMRVSPCALLAPDDRTALEWAEKSASISHNHPNAVHGAKAITHAIRLAYQGASKNDLRLRMETQWGYDLSLSVDELRKDFFFDVSCGGTVRAALICALNAQDFESTVRNAVSLGGDCDTTAAVAGPLAEALFGLPDSIKAQFMPLIPDEMKKIINRVYNHSSSLSILSGKQEKHEINDVFFTPENKLLLTGGWNELKNIRAMAKEIENESKTAMPWSEKEVQKAMLSGQHTLMSKITGFFNRF